MPSSHEPWLSSAGPGRYQAWVSGRLLARGAAATRYQVIHESPRDSLTCPWCAVVPFDVTQHLNSPTFICGWSSAYIKTKVELTGSYSHLSLRVVRRILGSPYQLTLDVKQGKPWTGRNPNYSNERVKRQVMFYLDLKRYLWTASLDRHWLKTFYIDFKICSKARLKWQQQIRHLLHFWETILSEWANYTRNVK